jgi:glucokinase
MGHYAGVDLGATNVRAVVADGDGTRLAFERDRTPRGPNGIAVTEAVLTALRHACETAGVDPESIRAVGIGSIGPLDLANGAVEDPANLPDSIETIPLVGPIENLIGGGPVHLHNDTAAGVIGERFHSERNPDDMAYLTISSGIGAGLCVDGHVLSGWDGNAGEIGHVTVDPRGRMTCGCGIDGHWEAYCSGENVPRYTRLLHDDDPIETDVPLSDPDFSAADVFAVAGDDRFADHVIEQVTRWNVHGLATLVHAYAPIVVYVGGAVALENPEAVIEPLREQLPSAVMSNVPEVRETTLGDDAVVEGALASARTGGTGDRDRLRR